MNLIRYILGIPGKIILTLIGILGIIMTYVLFICFLPTKYSNGKPMTIRKREILQDIIFPIFECWKWRGEDGGIHSHTTYS